MNNILPYSRVSIGYIKYLNQFYRDDAFSNKKCQLYGLEAWHDRYFLVMISFEAADVTMSPHEMMRLGMHYTPATYGCWCWWQQTIVFRMMNVTYIFQMRDVTGKSVWSKFSTMINQVMMPYGFETWKQINELKKSYLMLIYLYFCDEHTFF